MVEMKNSGIPWCGMIPIDWNVMPNKYVMYKQKDLCPKYRGEDILSLTMEGVIVRDLEAGGKMPATFDGYQIVHPNNLLMCLFDYDVTPRCIGLIKNEGLTSPAYSQFIMKNDNDANYYYYYYLMIDNTKELLHLAKNLRHSFTEDQLGAINTPVPPVEIQKKIASFLDLKCKEIDDVYSDIERQIETLEEYKKSVIAEAVTKGLDPNAEMKDSGIEWVGKMPSNWDVKKGKYCLTYVQKPTKEDDDVITCFRDGEVTLRSNRREEGFTISFKEIGYQGIDVGDLVVHGMDGFAGAIGISDSRGKASPVLNVLDTDNNKRYIMYYLRNMSYNGVFVALTTGIRVRTCDTNWGKLKELPYILPPIEEQNAIVKYIDDVINKVDAIIEEKKKQLEVLIDYKKSVIYEYITGKKEVPDNE
ncbi:restriction endonuclease subunit S [uncultured Clostridium sp.]|uniref:restriction endonuclease subunit S n=1 Tax=uncultured Clostridium sp. TaxID=59620 RepID=UPI0025F8FDFF|nr:restriction endonuclease subunit S [uncultured Clostridium sp.]